MAIHFNVPKLGFRYYLSFPHSGRCLLEVQFSSVAQSCLTFCDPMDCSMSASLSTTNSRSLLKLMSIRSVMPSNQSHPLLSPSPPALQGFPSIRVFFSKSVLHIRWPKYWSFSFSISPSNESSGLISFRVDWFSSVQLLSRVQLFVTPWITERQASLSITNSWSSLKLMSIESVMPSSHLILCHSHFLLPPIPPSIRVFSNELAFHIRWPKYWNFSFSISPSNEYSGLISFRIDL